MCKKLMVLLLVLGIASVATAANISFTGAIDSAWNKAGNWTPAAVPAVTDNARFYTAGVLNCTVTSSGVAIANKVQYRGCPGNSTVTVTGDLTTNGSVEIDTNGTATLNISAGATMDACTQQSGSSQWTSFKLGRASRSGASVCNVDGTLNVTSQSVDASELKLGYWSETSNAGGTWTLNIGGTGTVNADALVVNLRKLAGTPLIDIATGGLMVLTGDVQAQCINLRNGGIIKGDGGASAIGVSLIGGNTHVQVPEPAMIALLGLGGLLLRKRR
jgi:hypothetical protein